MPKIGETHTHRGWHIEFVYPPIPIRTLDWQYSHPDYDGPGDPRCGSAPTLKAAKAAVDEWIEDNKGEE